MCYWLVIIFFNLDVFGFYCCITNFHRLRDLKENALIITVSAGQELAQIGPLLRVSQTAIQALAQLCFLAGYQPRAAFSQWRPPKFLASDPLTTWLLASPRLAQEFLRPLDALRELI